MRPRQRAAPAPDSGQLTLFDQIHRAAGRPFAAWKNGGGQTAEILCHPAGAGFDDFGWRISTARVEMSGPFSTFPGVTRCLTVITGGQLRLAFPGGLVALLDDRAPPLVFPGDISCDCTLTGAAVLDLNVMLRAPFACTVTRGSMAGRWDISRTSCKASNSAKRSRTRSLPFGTPPFRRHASR